MSPSASKHPLSHYRCDHAIEYLKVFTIILFVYMQIQRGLFRAGLPIGNDFIHLLDSVLNTILIPLGFAITGWVFATASQNHSRTSNVLTLLDAVIYPYILWIILQGFFQTQFNFLTQSNYSFIHIVSLLPIEPYGHFECLYAAFFCAIFCLFLIKRKSIAFISLGLITAAAVYLTRDLFNYIAVFSVIAPYLFFFILGVGLSTVKHPILCASKYLGILALLCFIFFQWLFHGAFKSDPYTHSWQVLLVATTSITSLFIFFGAISRTRLSGLLVISKATFAIYLLHFLLIGGTRVLLIDVLNITHSGLNLSIAFLITLVGGLAVYHFSQRSGMFFLWRAPHFASAHTFAEKIRRLWQNKPTSKPMTLGLAILLAAPFIGVYGLSEAKVNQTYTIEALSNNIVLSSAPEDIANGKRLAQIYGCYLGCHAPEMQGQILEDKAFKGRIVAPNLTKSVKKYSTDELAIIVKQGLRPDSTALRGWMPTEAYQYIDDKSLADILSFISSQPLQNRTPKPYRLGWLSRIDLLTGQYKNHHKLAKNMPFDATTMSAGEKLARSACGECHGADLSGSHTTPALSIVKAYSFEEFKKLQRTGIAMGNREIGLMSLMARNRFSLLSDKELEELYQFLSELKSL